MFKVILQRKLWRSGRYRCQGTDQCRPTPKEIHQSTQPELAKCRISAWTQTQFQGRQCPWRKGNKK